MKKLLLILFAFALAGNVAWGQTSDLMISEYIEGSSNNKALEIYNGTGADVDLSEYQVWKISNGGNWPEATLSLSGTLTNGDVYVIYNSSAAQAIKDVGNITWGNANWNGDDAVGLAKDDGTGTFTLIDAVGKDGSDPGSGWNVAGTTNATKDHTLVRKETVCSPNTDWSTSAGTNATNSEWIVYSKDDFSHLGSHSSTCGGSSAPDNPASFTASAHDLLTSQIDLSWTQNSSNNDVMVVWSSDGTFGTPTDGTAYSSGSAISGGGTVIYNGSDTTYHHTGLTANTHYYYKAWSVDGSVNYSSGITADATTNKAEPTNPVASFATGTPASTSIPLTWSDNDGTVAADGYLLLVNTTGTFSDPVDGTPQNDDTDVSDGSGVVNVGHGDEAYTWTGLSSETHYYFKIYPYTNSGTAIDYKTDGAPSVDASTTAATPTNTDLIISEVADPSDVANAKFVEIYNAGSTNVDFGSETWYLSRQANGGSSWIDAQLTGTLDAGKTYVIGYNSTNFKGQYGFDADLYSGAITGNGDDGYFLYHDGDHSSGTLIDAYGVIDEDGTGKDWEYEDSHAVRIPGYGPNPTWTSSEWVITGANVANMTPSVYNAAFTWAGGTSADWGNKANWTIAGSAAPSIPDVSCTVTIPSGTANSCSVTGIPALESDAYSVIINSGASLDIPAGKALSLGNLTNNGTLTVQSSDASGNGSLIVYGTATGNITVQRYIAGYTAGSGNGNGWHEIGCPVQSMDIASTTFDPGQNDDLYKWNEAAADGKNWINYKATAFNFTAGNGYLIAHDGNTTYSYTGVLNTGSVTVNGLTYGGTGSGYQLLGNPYPSAISWNNGDWTLDHVGGIAQVWNEVGASYVPVNVGDIIPSTNGFFVEVSGGTGSVTIPESARTHSADNNYKSASAASPKETLTFKITDDANSYSDESILGFKPNATEDWDMAFDAHKLMSLVKTAPQIWTVSKDQKFLVNYLPETTTAYDVPLHFKPGVSTVYHLTIKGADSFDNTGLVLEDLKTGEKIDLSNTGSYDFSAEKGDDVNRFVLHINGVTAVPNVNETDGIQVFSYGNTIYLHGQNMLNGKVSIFNTLGQKVYDGLLNGAAKQQIRINQHKGIYFVRVEENNHVFTKKVFIQ